MANLYPFSVQAVYIAANNGDGTFGTQYMLESTKTLSTAQKLVSDRAQGNSQITALAAQSISYDLTLDTAGFDFSVLSILMGVDATSSGTGEKWTISNKLMPYFGMIAQTYPDDGDILLFFPRCKITGDWTYKLDFGKIVVPQFKCEAIRDLTLDYTLEMLERPDGGSIAFPPQI